MSMVAKNEKNEEQHKGTTPYNHQVYRRLLTSPGEVFGPVRAQVFKLRNLGFR